MSIQAYPNDSLVVVADGNQAKFYRLTRDGDSLSLAANGSLEPKDLEDDGPSGVRPPESSPEDIDEATFAKQLAHHLNRQAEKNAFDALVLIADPQTLGQLRPIFSKSTTDRLSAELGKTLTNSSTDEIVRSLKASV